MASSVRLPALTVWGAGKSMAVNALEDIGFFCIDNIPAGLLPRILDFAQQGENQLSRVAVVMDIRGLHSVHGAPYPRLAESNPAKGGIRRMTQEKETNRQAEQGKAETEIPCAVCRDLIPLVQDGVASPESEALVKAHLQTCPECRTLWQAGGGQALPQSLPAPDDARLLQKIRHKYNTGVLLFVRGAVLAVISPRSLR